MTATKKRTADQWKKKRIHAGVTLPSGFQVDIALPNLAAMLKAGVVPNPLIDSAIKHAEAQRVTADMLKETWDFTRWIVPKMVVNPEITEEDIDELPIEDVEMLAGFASRTNDIDAVGHHLGGLETYKSFRDLRGLTSIEEALADIS